jgi:hypothetical protein
MVLMKGLSQHINEKKKTFFNMQTANEILRSSVIWNELQWFHVHQHFLVLG